MNLPRQRNESNWQTFWVKLSELIDGLTSKRGFGFGWISWLSTTELARERNSRTSAFHRPRSVVQNKLNSNHLNGKKDSNARNFVSWTSLVAQHYGNQQSVLNEALLGGQQGNEFFSVVIWIIANLHKAHWRWEFVLFCICVLFKTSSKIFRSSEKKPSE